MSQRLNRRQFVRTSAALGACGLMGRLVRAAGSANDRLHVGVIGVAGQGAYDLREVAKAGTEIVALCDVDENRSLEARRQFPRAKFHIDFRRLLDQKGLDAVVIATPDHTHAPAALRALRAGLHVYCEKPLAHTVAEVRLVAEAAAREKRVTQMGTQIHAGSNYRRVVEIIQSGAIGPVPEVHVWCAKAWAGGDRPKETPAVPSGLHYDLWLGPAPYRPYHPTYIPFFWRGWWDFGGGTLADMACHYLDLPFWALGLGHPEKVAAAGPRVHRESAPEWLIVHYEFAARGAAPPVKLTWYHGAKRPRLFEEQVLPPWGDGVLFVGEKGMLLADYNHRRLLPDEKFAAFQPPPPSIPDSIGHHREWVEACKSGGPTTCNFGYGAALSETALLGNVAYRSGRAFNWDAKNLRAVNDSEVDRFLHKEYRKPWTQ